MEMTQQPSCPRCGAKVSTNALGGLCPICTGRRLMKIEAPAAERPPENALETLSPAESIGSKLGRYTLKRKLGEGGCGSVYEAEQHEPVRRRTALKVIKLGMDTKSVVARFEAERQALAIMDHPNVARVFDAGATETGRPFFVMELVDGVRITDYCDQHRLDLRARLELFILVCHAVQHAHQKGLIHRDLKPSNILVTTVNGRSEPKIIDFGIAKATEQTRSDATLLTDYHQLLGTPAYMSPEQAEPGAVDIDTRSDIYSLGALLSELLTGQPPFGARGAFVRGGEPARPSALVAMLPPGEIATVAEARSASPRGLRSELRGDLDLIVLKCLERDRSRRYASAAALADDLRRRLSNEPVAAVAPSALYRLGKLARRHKLALAGTALFMLLLAGTAGFSLFQAARAARAEALATKRLSDYENAQGESEAVAGFLVEIFQGPNPAGRNGRSVTVAEVLAGAARRIEKDLGGFPERQAKLRTILGDTYLSLGLVAETIEMREQVYQYRLKTLGRTHLNTLEALDSLGLALYESTQRNNEAIQLFEQVLDGYSNIFGLKHPKTIAVMGRLGWAVHPKNNEKGLEIQEQVFALSREINGDEHPSTIEAMTKLGYNHILASHYPRARMLLDESVELLRKRLGDDHPETISARIMQALCLARSGEHDRAIPLLTDLTSLSERVNGPFHTDNLFAMSSLGRAYEKANRNDEAIATFKEVLATSRKINPAGHARTITALRDLAKLNEKAGRAEEAEEFKQELAAEQAVMTAKKNGPEINNVSRIFTAGTAP